MTSVLETHAEAVAREVLPDEPQDSERGIDFITIITMVISIITSIVQNCPKSDSEVANDLRNPNRRQQAAVLKETKQHCDCCNMVRHTGRLNRALLVHGSALNQTDALALVREARNDQNLLV